MPRRIPDFPDYFNSWNYLSSIGSGITFISFGILSSFHLIEFILLFIMYIYWDLIYYLFITNLFINFIVFGFMNIFLGIWFTFKVMGLTRYDFTSKGYSTMIQRRLLINTLAYKRIDGWRWKPLPPNGNVTKGHWLSQSKDPSIVL